MVEPLKKVLDGNVDHPAVKFENVVEFLAICWQWFFGGLLSLAIKLLFSGFEGCVSGTLLIALFLLLHLFWIRETDFQVLLFEIEVSFEALSLDPRDYFLHLSLTNATQIVIVPRP